LKIVIIEKAWKFQIFNTISYNINLCEKDVSCSFLFKRISHWWWEASECIHHCH